MRFARSFGEFRGDLGGIPGAKEPRPTLLEGGGSAEYLGPPGRRTDSLARHLWHGSLWGAGFKGLRPHSADPLLIHPRCEVLLVVRSGIGACLRNANVLLEDDSDRFVKLI